MTRLLLRFFPAAWRARYGKELLDLVSETGVTPRIAADLIRAGVAERARVARETLTGGTTMVLGPAWRHPRAWAIFGLIALLPTLSLIALSLARPYQLERAGLAGMSIRSKRGSTRTAWPTYFSPCRRRWRCCSRRLRSSVSGSPEWRESQKPRCRFVCSPQT